MKRRMALVLALTLVIALALGACTGGANYPKLDPKNPITLEIWHYYNGPQKTAFDNMVTDFNDTVGLEQGVIVEAFSQGNVNALSEKVLASAAGAVGADPLPAIFASYADTAYEVDKLGLLADLDTYFSKDEQNAYRAEFLAEGRFSVDGSLKIFPVAKSVELLMLNQTDWDKFAAATGADLGELETIEGVVRISEAYYNWTDSLTNQPGDGKAFFGRDAMANYMIIGAQQLGQPLFVQEEGQMKLQLDRAVLRRLWDNYYIPFTNGWFSANGRFRSDEANLGDIIALVGSSSGAAYFPTEVALTDFQSYPIQCTILPAPHFAGGAPYAIQQGAGLAVSKSTPQQEYACALFLKWFTEPERNSSFSTASGGYLPVTAAALDAALILRQLTDYYTDPAAFSRMEQTFSAALKQMSEHTMYTPPPFDGTIGARAVLERSLSDWAKSDREAILALIAQGVSAQEAAAQYQTDQRFDEWMTQLSQELKQSLS